MSSSQQRNSTMTNGSSGSASRVPSLTRFSSLQFGASKISSSTPWSLWCTLQSATLQWSCLRQGSTPPSASLRPTSSSRQRCSSHKATRLNSHPLPFSPKYSMGLFFRSPSTCHSPSTQRCAGTWFWSFTIHSNRQRQDSRHTSSSASVWWSSSLQYWNRYSTLSITQISW